MIADRYRLGNHHADLIYEISYTARLDIRPPDRRMCVAATETDAATILAALNTCLDPAALAIVLDMAERQPDPYGDEYDAMKTVRQWLAAQPKAAPR